MARSTDRYGRGDREVGAAKASEALGESIAGGIQSDGTQSTLPSASSGLPGIKAKGPRLQELTTLNLSSVEQQNGSTTSLVEHVPPRGLGVGLSRCGTIGREFTGTGRK